MRRNFDENATKLLTEQVRFLVGDAETVQRMPARPSREPFSEAVCAFLADLSGRLMKMPESRAYSDVMTYAFWIRKASLEAMKTRFPVPEGYLRLGRGTAFHIAPSNVPVNFAYSLTAALLLGNANIVRVSQKEFPQVELIARAMRETLADHPALQGDLVLVRYERNREINDAFSAISDTRIVWGGDATIAELRKSPLPPRAAEITFADRYSLAVINADAYLKLEDPAEFARSFYNDTYFSDQNACTSPRVVVWTGEKKAEAKSVFWEKLHELVRTEYAFQEIQAVNKLTGAYLACNAIDGAAVVPSEDNLILRIQVQALTADLQEHFENSGFFYEYDCDDIMDLRELCNDTKCQTVGYLGDREAFLPLLQSGIRGIDRIVPIGRTMDFDLIWDGYDLPAMLTRLVRV